MGKAGASGLERAERGAAVRGVSNVRLVRMELEDKMTDRGQLSLVE